VQRSILFSGAQATTDEEGVASGRGPPSACFLDAGAAWDAEIEIVDELTFDEVTDEGPSCVLPSAFEQLLTAMQGAARSSGITGETAELLRALLGFSRHICVVADSPACQALLAAGIIEMTGADFVRTRAFTTQVIGWKAVLSGAESWGDCVPAPLDEWSATLVACASGRPDAQITIRRELRWAGVAAFGFVAAA
jgi:hypothetical protein